MNTEQVPAHCSTAATPIRSAAASASPPHSTAPPLRAARSVRPGSPAPPESTAHSSTGTVTCWRRSTPCKPSHPRRRHRSRCHPGLAASRPPRSTRTCHPAQHPHPSPGKTPVRSPRRPGLARVRARRPRRHRRPQPEDHSPGTTGPRPEAAGRRTRRRPRRRPCRQQRTHDPAQPPEPTPVTRPARSLHHTCCSR